MRSLYLQAAAILIIGACVSSARSQLLPSQAKGAARAQIVMLSVNGGCAAGIIVGYDEKSIYIATAAHIADLSKQPFPFVTVRFEGLAKSPSTGKFLPQFETKEKGDLAVVSVGRDGSTNKFLDELDFAVLSAVPLGPANVPVTSIGCFGGAEWSSGSNETLLTPEQGYLRFQSDVGEGQSGGGLYNEAWELIGMPLDVGDNGVYARPIAEILEDLRKWGVPTRLGPRPPKDRVRGADEIARENAAIAQSQELAARGRSMAKERLDVALLLTLEAYRTYPSAEARTALLETLQYSPYFARLVLPPGSGARTAAFSADGAIMAIATESKSVELRSAQDLGRSIATLQTPDVVDSLFFTPDNRKLVTCYGHNSLWVSDTNSLTSVEERWPDYKQEDSCMALSPDGTKLAYSKDDNALMLWDIVRSQPVGKLMPAPLTSEHFTGYDKNGNRVEGWRKRSVTLNAVAFSPDGNTLAAAYDDWTILLWDARTGNRIREPLRGHSSFVKTVAFSPDGTKLVSGSQDGTLRFWDPATSRAMSKSLEAHGGEITQAVFSPDGKWVVSAGFDGTLILWNISEGATYAYPLQERLTGHTAPVEMLQWNRERGEILSVASDGSVILWKDTFQNVSLMPALNVNSISLSRDGDLLVSGGYGGAVTVWNMRTRTATRALRMETKDEIKAVAISPDARSAAAAGANSITIWDIATGRPLATRERPHDSEVTDLAYSPNGAVVASCGRDGLIRMWNASNLSPVSHPMRGDKWEVLHLAFSPDGKTIVSSSRSGLVQFWDAGTSEPNGEPIRADGDETRVAFSPDGERLVTGTDRAVIEIWDVRSRKREGSPIPAKGVVTGVAFSPDGNVFSTGNGDGLVRLWDSRAQAILEPALRAHDSFINDIVFDPKGRYVAACAHDGIAIIDLMPQDWAVQICQRVARNFTTAEWGKYIPRQSYRKTCPGLASRD